MFFSLFYMLRKDLKLDICPGIVKYAAQHGTSITNVACNQVDPGSAKFLFIPDLTAHATGWVLAVLLVLYVGSQLLSSVLMSVTADRNQRFIMIALPFVFVTFIRASRPACSSTGSPRTCGRSSSSTSSAVLRDCLCSGRQGRPASSRRRRP